MDTALRKLKTSMITVDGVNTVDARWMIIVAFANVVLPMWKIMIALELAQRKLG